MVRILFTPMIRTQNRTKWQHEPDGLTASAAPNLDYEHLKYLIEGSAPKISNNRLRGLLKQAWEPQVEDDVELGLDDPDEYSRVFIRDVRTAAYTLDDVDENKHVEELEQNSLIPVPGLMINYENDDATTAPIVSDWIQPHGPFWNSNT